MRHKGTNTRVSVLAGDGKGAQGLVRTPFIFADEPGAWETSGGEMLHDTIQSSHGKPGSNLRVIYIGTLWPAMGGWWHDLVKRGSHGSTHVTSLQGDVEKWRTAPELRRCNPLVWRYADKRAVLLEERDEARGNTRIKARFLSTRLNIPAQDETKGLFGADEWEGVLSRPVPPRQGLPLWGVDLGGSRAWSAVVAVWTTGRVEAVAMTAGQPDIREQEKRDRVPKGTYQALVERRVLVADPDGKWEPNPSRLLDLAASRFGGTAGIIADYYKRSAMADIAESRWPVTFRRAGWEDASEDIDGTRRQALDGGLGVAEDARALLSWSLSVAQVKPDDRGNIRLTKADMNNRSRNDVASAFVLAAGAVDRARRQAPRDLKVY